MSKKFAKGEFTPKNAAKYVGKRPIIYRSSWELVMMTKLDQHPNVLAWASESVEIPYLNPVLRKWSVYIPDFLICYVDANNKQLTEMVEIKPRDETPGYQKVSERTGRAVKQSLADREVQAVNAAKWQSAVKFCAKRGWNFRVATEDLIFKYKRK